MFSPRVFLFPLLLGVAGLAARADDLPASPGHSTHGEAFNEGPRQRAVLLPGMGAVHFPITTSSPEAQQFFDQGVGQLHGFWYFEAERSFRQVAALDPQCVMAYWGLAMANANNAQRALEFAKLAVAKQAQVSRREQLWIATLGTVEKQPDGERRAAQVRALEKLSYEFPEDVEAKAFLVMRLWDNSEHGLPLGSRQAVEALAQQVLAANPQHPIYHYLIHLWNNGEDDRRALPAAAQCGPSAPGIAHMWHMPGHTFSKLHRYADAAWHQEAAARVDHAQMAAARLMPEQIFNYAHNNKWLVENLGYVGRAQEAWDLAKNMIELPQLPPKGAEQHGPHKGHHLGREALLETAVRFALWPQLTALAGTPYLAQDAEDPEWQVARLLALGQAYYALGQPADAEYQLTDLEAEANKVNALRLAAADEAERKARAANKPPVEVTGAMGVAMRTFSKRQETTQAALAELRVYQALAQGSAADETLRKLDRVKDLPPLRRARILLAMHNLPAAEVVARTAVAKGEGDLLPLALLAETLWQAGKKPAALEAFQKARALAAQADLQTTPLAALAPLAQAAGLPVDWRPPLATQPDTGTRPPLESLGPFRWQPYPAPEWKLSTQNGETFSLAQFRGQPVLMLFYLGSGCSRCLEQLNVFAPLVQTYAGKGIKVVAVSADSAEALHETFAKAKSEPFTFPILADPTLELFKTYRVYDDFEKMPLHGVFLIDGEGLVRWQDISFEAMLNAKWLLGEAQRLLALPVSGPEVRTAAVK